MEEISSLKTHTNSQSLISEPINYITEIRQMMHGFGDSSEPLIESARIIEEVVLQQMRCIVNKACNIADMQGISTVSPENLIFLLRKDKIKLKRLLNYLRLKKYRSLMNKYIQSNGLDNPEANLLNNSRDSKDCYNGFIDLIDTTEEILENRTTVDIVKQNRALRADMMSQKLDEARYIEFSKARSISFANKNRHKFSDWISQDGDIQISKEAYVILGYLAYETVAQIIDLTLLVRQDQKKLYGDAIDRIRIHQNTNLEPLSPAEIGEALRRYWSEQLDMTGPFHRRSMHPNHLKLLSC